VHLRSDLALLEYSVTARDLVAVVHALSLDSRSWVDPRKQEPVQQERCRVELRPGFH
jgi:hypothetical protein